MTYTQAEQYILTLGNLKIQGRGPDQHQSNENLKRVQLFLNILKNPEKQIPHYIHVTGTSGKGSVCSFLQSILVASGKKTGLFVSPHPTEIRERWKVNNAYMTKQEFINMVQTLKPALETYLQTSPYGMLSFLDITVAIGLLFFAQQKVQWAVVEVGLGGTFDSTNILPSKDIAIITNIGLDHTEILGKTKKEIAHHKSGIIQKGAAVFTMEKDKKILEVIEKECLKHDTILHIVKQSTKTHPQKWNLIGEHQVQNTLFCTQVAEYLQIPKNIIEKGIERAKQPLRMEIISKNPMVILDGAHSIYKMQTTVDTARSLPHARLHLIVGFSADKQFHDMIQQLGTLCPTTVACTRNTVNPFRKVANPVEIAKLFKKYAPKAKIKISLDPQEALRWSTNEQKTNDILLATGSIFLSGELRKFLK